MLNYSQHRLIQPTPVTPYAKSNPKFDTPLDSTVGHFTNNLHVLHSPVNSHPLCIFTPLMYKTTKYFTNMKISLTKLFESLSVIGCFMWPGKKVTGL